MLNEFLRLMGLALIAVLLAFAGLVSSQSAFGQRCASAYPASKADQVWCEQAVATGVTPVFIVKDSAP